VGFAVEIAMVPSPYVRARRDSRLERRRRTIVGP
jgi:hypothetical protein